MDPAEKVTSLPLVQGASPGMGKSGVAGLRTMLTRGGTELSHMSRFHKDENVSEVIAWLGSSSDAVRLFVVYDGVVDGKVTSVGLENTDGVSPAMLSRFPWKKFMLIADVERRMSKFEYGSEELIAHSEQWKEAVNAATEGRKIRSTDPLIRPGRRGHPDAHYKEIAARYLQLLRQGETAPVKVIADEYHVNRSTAAGWVGTARKRDMMPEGRRGRAG